MRFLPGQGVIPNGSSRPRCRCWVTTQADMRDRTRSRPHLPPKGTLGLYDTPIGRDGDETSAYGWPHPVHEPHATTANCPSTDVIGGANHAVVSIELLTPLSTRACNLSFYRFARQAL